MEPILIKLCSRSRRINTANTKARQWTRSSASYIHSHPHNLPHKTYLNVILPSIFCFSVNVFQYVSPSTFCILSLPNPEHMFRPWRCRLHFLPKHWLPPTASRRLSQRLHHSTEPHACGSLMLGTNGLSQYKSLLIQLLLIDKHRRPNYALLTCFIIHRSKHFTLQDFIF